jgi:23S rRNA pseudouridine2605 synthase
MRLNQYIAKYQGISRRLADQLIIDGRVLINQNIATLGQQVDETKDTIEISSSNKLKPKILTIDPKTFENQTIIFYKPIFCLTTRYDPQKRKTIYDFLPKQFGDLKTAGRLDYMSEGLLILSNDGHLIDDLTHPRNEHIKKYLVGVNQKLTPEFIKVAQSGNMEIDEYTLNEVKITPLDKETHAKFSYLKLQPTLTWYQFDLSEGRNNQIRKMVESFGQKVQRLIRIEQGQYQISPQLMEQKFLIV